MSRDKKGRDKKGGYSGKDMKYTLPRSTQLKNASLQKNVVSLA